MSTNETLNRKPIFNRYGYTDIDNRFIINGNTTNIIELNNIKYNWAYDLYKTMGIRNFWIPDEISMIDDKKQYESILTDYEKKAYELTLAFLIALDSYQINILKELASFITAPELVMAITAQEFQESLHSFSYQHILESVVTPHIADRVYNLWREDEKLLERYELIAQIYNEFVQKPTIENFIKAIVADYILESLYFYSGFAFFYVLGRQGKMRNTVQQIKYINRDELTHVTLFRNIIITLKQERPDIFTQEINNWIYEAFKFATDREIQWGKYITNNQILGLNDEVIDKYIKYLANLRLQQINYEPIFDQTENPLAWIDTYRSINDTKTDFFQAKPQTYTKGLKW